MCLLIFCCRIFILFATWDPKSCFKSVCDQKSFILCRYRTRITLNNRVMWTVSDLSMLVSIASRFPPGPLEAEWPVFASTRNYTQRLHAPLSRTACTWRVLLEPLFTTEDFYGPYQDDIHSASCSLPFVILVEATRGSRLDLRRHLCLRWPSRLPHRTPGRSP